MATFLESPPMGFLQATEAVARLTPAKLEILALQVCKFLLQRTGSLSLEELAAKSSKSFEERETRSMGPSALLDARQAVTALTFIFRDAARAEASPEMMSVALMAASHLSPESCACITKVYRSKHPLLVGADRVKAVLSMGKLIGMDWKLSVATESCECSKMKAPVVVLRFRVADASGQAEAHSVELTVSEFEDFAAKVNEMSAVMETL
mmetsp:Transcript_71679/g.105043  ORF Transcript_71679/g.105043 Transcript_71679/m.105043 type:complete len:209 (-) Transcript_71679:164-790(-)